MNRLFPWTAMLALAIAFSGCSSVTFRPQEDRRLNTYADAEISHDYYLWGTVGRFEVDAEQMCHGRRARQVQTLFTLSDQIYSIATLGIYTPRTLKIWCY